MAQMTAQRLPVFDDAGRTVEAHFSVAGIPGGIEVTIESRGGTIGSSGARNAEYATGLRILLQRLANRRCVLHDAVLVSAPLLAQQLSPAERQVQGINFPVELAPSTDTAELAAQLQRGQGTVGSSATSGKGNTTRRMMLALSAGPMNRDDLGKLLSEGAVPAGLGSLPAGTTSLMMAAYDDFVPDGLTDARIRVVAALTQREGQPAFRRALLDAYGQKCAVTGCDLVDALEGAHILPYWGPQTNHVQNGLLLRSDVHTLFDRGLVGVDPVCWTVVTHPRLDGTSYASLEGAAIARPAVPSNYPSVVALKRHLEAAGLVSLRRR